MKKGQQEKENQVNFNSARIFIISVHSSDWLKHSTNTCQVQTFTTVKSNSFNCKLGKARGLFSNFSKVFKAKLGWQ